MLLHKTCQRLIGLGKKSAQGSPKALSAAGLIELHTFKVLEGDYGVNIKGVRGQISSGCCSNPILSP